MISNAQGFLLLCLFASVCLQVGAAVLALQLIGVTGRRRAWIFVSLAILLMTVRRILSFSEAVSGAPEGRHDLMFEVVGLATSAFMFAGIALIRPVFLALRRSEEALREMSEERGVLLDHTRDMVYRHDLRGIFTYVSPAAERLTGHTAQEWKSHYATFLTENPANAVGVARTEEALRSGREQPPYELELFGKDGTKVWLEVNERPYFENGKVAGIIGVARDVTPRKQEAAERERLLAELQEASSKIRVLSGFLPICASCKKIRDDKGYWNQLEEYISAHSEAEFSHGLCPQCASRLYPQFFTQSDA